MLNNVKGIEQMAKWLVIASEKAYICFALVSHENIEN